MAVHRSGSGSGGAVPWLAYLVAAVAVVVGALLWKGCTDTLASHPRAVALNLWLPPPSMPKFPKPPSEPQ